MGLRGLAASLDAVLGVVVDAAGAALVVAECLTILAGVTARYVLGTPLVWADEVASALFLWLAMLGAVIAFRRAEHMRMGALADGTPTRQAFAAALGLAASLCFVALVLRPAVDYALGEVLVSTPALEMSGGWRAMALPVGLGLMLLSGVARVFELPRPRDVALAFGVVACIGLLLFLGRPMLAGIGNYRLVVFFVVLVGACVLAGIPIAFSFGLATFAFLGLTTRLPLTVVVGRMDEGMSHLILLAVPLFVILGLLIEITGMARAMVGFLASLMGHVRGGLHYVLVAAIYLVSGISGAKAADMAAIAPVLFPEMRKRGARPGDLVALLAATGAQTETVPPSLVLITIGSVTGVSISALFIGGLLPGVVLGLVLCGVVFLKFRGEDMSAVRRARLPEVLRALLIALPSLLLPLVIRTAVVEGVATATEVSTIGIAYVLLYGLAAAFVFRDRVEWRRLAPALVETASLSGAILFIIGTATAMAWALTQSGFSRQLAAVMTGLPGGAASFMAVSILVFMVLGSVLEGIPAIVLFGPLLFPIARAVGIHEVHYAIVVILAMGIGLFAPPFGVGFYAACAIGRVPPGAAVRPIWPYLGALLAGTVLIAAVPWLSIGFLGQNAP